MQAYSLSDDHHHQRNEFDQGRRPDARPMFSICVRVCVSFFLSLSHSPLPYIDPLTFYSSLLFIDKKRRHFLHAQRLPVDIQSAALSLSLSLSLFTIKNIALVHSFGCQCVCVHLTLGLTFEVGLSGSVLFHQVNLFYRLSGLSVQVWEI